MKFECTSLKRVSSRRYGDAGAVTQERMTVVLEAVRATDDGHPNRQAWTTGLPDGLVRLAELPTAVGRLYELHRTYWVEITPADDDATKREARTMTEEKKLKHDPADDQAAPEVEAPVPGSVPEDPAPPEPEPAPAEQQP
jgi:hypothetical protein